MLSIRAVTRSWRHPARTLGATVERNRSLGTLSNGIAAHRVVGSRGWAQSRAIFPIVDGRRHATHTEEREPDIEYHHDLSTPFEIPVQEKDGRPYNVFVMNNNKSRFIALNRPRAHNALTLDMVNDLYEIYREVEANASIDLVLLYGASWTAFCAGGDVAALAKQKPVPMGQPAPQMEFFRSEYKLNHLIGNFSPKFQIALLNGITMGGGVGLSVHGKFRICTDDTVFAMPETQIGFFPDVGGSWVLPRMDDNVGYYLALTGHKLNCMEAWCLGLATHYIDLGQIPRFLERVMFNDDFSNASIERLILEFSEDPDEEDCGVDTVTPNLEVIKRCFQPHFSIKEIKNALKQEAGPMMKDRQFALDTLTELDKASPTSLAVTMEVLRRGSKMKNLGECLEMEFRVARRFMAGGDFFEGIRAMLIDKDRNPHWDEAPSPETVLEYFAQLPKGEELVLPKFSVRKDEFGMWEKMYSE